MNKTPLPAQGPVDVLVGRLRAHAEAHEYIANADEEQRQWMHDLYDAADALERAPRWRDVAEELPVPPNLNWAAAPEIDVKIVPEKPTPEMEDAGTKALSDSGVDDVYVSVPEEGVIGDAAKCYEAMIAVAPMPTAVWEDGEPANLLAAGEDAYAWLAWLQQHARTFLMKQEDQSRLEKCMVALNSFLRPKA